MSKVFKVSLGALLAAGSLNVSMAQAPQPAAALFENVRVFDGMPDRLSAPSYVLVVGKTITALSAAPIPAPAGESPTKIEGGGRTLMPGLIDAHVHITMSARRQRELLDPKVGPEGLQARASEEAL